MRVSARLKWIQQIACFIAASKVVSSVRFETYGVFTPLSLASIEVKLPSSPKRGLPSQLPSQE
jgi:hypothetical protein